MTFSGTSLLWLLPVAFSLLYWLGTTGLLAVRMRRQGTGGETAAPRLPPVVFLRPVKPGVPRLEEKVCRLLTSARAGDWVVFGVNDALSLAIVRRLTTEGGMAVVPAGVIVRVVECGPAPVAENRKVAKLHTMTVGLGGEAPGRWILSDSELLLAPGEMDTFRREWAESGATAFTAGYRFVGARRLPEWLDHLPLWGTLWPGLAIAERFSKARSGGLGFTLGACSGFEQRDLERLGGWEALLPYLAEDNRLGAALSASGREVRLASHVFTLDSDPMGWGDWVRHQHRVAVTYRCCDPVGVFGMGLTYGALWCLPLATSPIGWALLAGVVFVRVMTLWANRRLVERAAFFGGGAVRVPWRFWVAAGVVSLLEGVFWLVAWLPLPVYWAGQRYRLGCGGRFKTAQ